jgi:Fe-S oxidoreductase
MRQEPALRCLASRKAAPAIRRGELATSSCSKSRPEANVDALNEAQVKRIVTSCPHCFHTLKNEYPQFGGKYEVIHHSELLAHLLSSGKLKPETKMDQKVTFHDSCYLGRWNGVYDAPRSVLEAVSSGELIELGRKKGAWLLLRCRWWSDVAGRKGPPRHRNRTEEVLRQRGRGRCGRVSRSAPS